MNQELTNQEKTLPVTEEAESTTKTTFIQRFKNLKKGARIAIISGSSVVLLLLVLYFGFAIYFSNHFYFGTQINSTSCSGKNIAKATELMEASLDTYSITIKEDDNKSEIIKGSEFDMNARLNSDLSVLKKEQNPFTWPVYLFKTSQLEADIEIDYDEAKLKQLLMNLDCMQEDNMKAPESATISFDTKANEYIIEKETDGTKLNPEETAKKITDAILDIKTTFDLRKEKCYEEPAVTEASESITQALNDLNKYLTSIVHYNILGNKETVDAKIIQTVLSWNEKFEINIKTDVLKELVSQWANKYNTYGKEKILDTSYNQQVTITKGRYGWKINVDDTTAELADAIKSGKTDEKEPVYSSKGAVQGDASRDYGNTYVEINLGTQHLFLYKDGQLVIETDFVSGKVTNGNATPVGIYPVTYKTSPAILRGDDYASPVTYWMPFNGGVGMHDATWRKKFGGDIYYRNGSHGCINLPFKAAKVIYQNISAGTPVIVYDLKVEEQEEIELTPEEIIAAEREQDPSQTTIDVTIDTVVDVTQNDNNTQGNTNSNVTVQTPAPIVTVAPVQTPEPTPVPTVVPTEIVTPTENPIETATPTEAVDGIQ